MMLEYIKTKERIMKSKVVKETFWALKNKITGKYSTGPFPDNYVALYDSRKEAREAKTAREAVIKLEVTVKEVA